MMTNEPPKTCVVFFSTLFSFAWPAEEPPDAAPPWGEDCAAFMAQRLRSFNAVTRVDDPYEESDEGGWSMELVLKQAYAECLFGRFFARRSARTESGPASSRGSLFKFWMLHGVSFLRFGVAAIPKRPDFGFKKMRFSIASAYAIAPRDERTRVAMSSRQGTER